MRNRARWRALLAREKRWAAEFVPTPPALRARDLVPGNSYLAVSHHEPWCMIYAWGKCLCGRPNVKFYAAREKEDDLDYAA
jgi:hypothetical protein